MSRTPLADRISRTNEWRRRRDSNPRLEVLQTSDPTLANGAESSKEAHAAYPLLRTRYAPEPEWLRRAHDGEGHGLARDESGLQR